MSGHTPGPWEIEPLQGKYYGTRILLDSGVIEVWTDGSRPPKPSEREIADGWTPDVGMNHVESEEDYANARLIAAAPELLEALRALYKVLEPAEGDFSKAEQFAMELARAAIRKATGEA